MMQYPNNAHDWHAHVNGGDGCCRSSEHKDRKRSAADDNAAAGILLVKKLRLAYEETLRVVVAAPKISSWCEDSASPEHRNDGSFQQPPLGCRDDKDERWMDELLCLSDGEDGSIEEECDLFFSGLLSDDPGIASPETNSSSFSPYQAFHADMITQALEIGDTADTTNLSESTTPRHPPSSSAFCVSPQLPLNENDDDAFQPKPFWSPSPGHPHETSYWYSSHDAPVPLLPRSSTTAADPSKERLLFFQHHHTTDW
jgi:hypothetical protein